MAIFTSTLQVALGTSAMLFSCPVIAGQTVVDVVRSSPDHTTFVNLLTQASLVEILHGHGPMTIFAPTDAAFNAMGRDTVGKLHQDEWSGHAMDFLLYHVYNYGTVPTSALTSQQVELRMANGDYTLTISTEDVAKDPTRHNLKATNGVVHVVNQVLQPPSITSNIVDILESSAEERSPQLSTMAELLRLADGMVETLQGEGPFTVFVPTNEAFAELDVERLKSSPDKLKDILTRHIKAGNLYDSALTDGQITMLNGADVAVTVGPPTMIEDATILSSQEQILASNGVVHVIDKVLLPSPTEERKGKTAPGGLRGKVGASRGD